MANTKEIVRVVLDELTERGLIHEQRRSAYSSTELLLYNYKNLKRSIDENNREIEELRKYGVPKKSASVIGMDRVDGGEQKDELVLIEERVDHLEQSNARTAALIQKIDRLITEYSDIKYPDLVKRLYFEERTREECADAYHCDVKTISRNKSRIVNRIKAILFPNDVVNELGC